jgi:predicted peptidase
MIKRISLILLVILISNLLAAQDLSIFEKHLFINRKDTLPYRLLLPRNYDPHKTYPLLLFLHGSGERGIDNAAQLVHGGDFFLRDSIRKNYPAIVVFPQCAEEDFWVTITEKNDSLGKGLFYFENSKVTTSLRLVQLLIKNIIKKKFVDPQKIYVGGLSMGGMGTFEIVRRSPELFAAAFVICGGADVTIAHQLKKVNWWIFHGAKDESVNPHYAVTMVQALQKINTIVKFTLYPDAGHNSWDNVFTEPEFIPWLFSNKKINSGKNRKY